MTSTTTATDTQYLGCHACRCLHPLAPEAGPMDDEAAAAAAEALGAFRADHADHLLHLMWRHGPARRASGPVWDPMSVLLFPVTDGHATYVVTAERSSIEKPRVYRFAPGDLESATTTVSFEDHHLLRGLDRELSPYALPPSKLDRFLDAVREVLRHIDVDELDVAFDDADDPAVSIARLPDVRYAKLVESCARIFDASELPRVNGFLAANRFEDGLLALRVRHDYRIATTA